MPFSYGLHILLSCTIHKIHAVLKECLKMSKIQLYLSFSCLLKYYCFRLKWDLTNRKPSEYHYSEGRSCIL